MSEEKLYHMVEAQVPSAPSVVTFSVINRDHGKAVFVRSAQANDLKERLVNMCKALGVEEHLNGMKYN